MSCIRCGGIMRQTAFRSTKNGYLCLGCGAIKYRRDSKWPRFRNKPKPKPKADSEVDTVLKEFVNV